mmetsp:Transcript_87815/g.251567  ORF Transcript_87815/g.251567 Transcript_87815/m.251567 type:complete len:281 (-) Transcript_87815:357-1199(-)
MPRDKGGHGPLGVVCDFTMGSESRARRSWCWAFSKYAMPQMMMKAPTKTCGGKVSPRNATEKEHKMIVFNLPMICIELAPSSLMAYIPSKFRAVALTQVAKMSHTISDDKLFHALPASSQHEAYESATMTQGGACRAQTCMNESELGDGSAEFFPSSAYAAGARSWSCSTTFEERSNTETPESVKPMMMEPLALLSFHSTKPIKKAPTPAMATPAQPLGGILRPRVCDSSAVVIGARVPMIPLMPAPIKVSAWLLNTTDSGKESAIGNTKKTYLLVEPTD